MQTTENYELNLVENTDMANIPEHFNYNFSKLETLLVEAYKKIADIESITNENKDKIDILDNRDYIVEQGTDGIWTYEKWASGKAVCWGTSLHESVAMTKEQGGSWYADGQTISFPTNLFNQAPKCVNHNCRVSNGYLVCFAINEYSASGISGYFNSINKSITSNVYADIYARGTWK